MARWILTAAILTAVALAASAQQPAQATPPVFQTPSDVAGCSWIAAHDPTLLPLAKVCEQWQSTALSSLPDFICEQQTVRTQTINGVDLSVIKRIDKLTAEVTYQHGHDYYSDFKLNGHPVDSMRLPSGMWSEGEFSPLVLMVLKQSSAPELKKSHDVKIDGARTEVYGYTIKQANNRSWSWRVGGKRVYYPGFIGTILVTKSTGELKRLVQVANDMDATAGLDYLAVQTDYGDTNIEGLGTFLLPVRSLWVVCHHNERCAHNVITFDRCRKFAAKSRIVPDSGQPRSDLEDHR